MESDVLSELIKHGWFAAPDDISHTVFARRPVETFRGQQYAQVFLTHNREYEQMILSAKFISEGKNAAALCCAYINKEDEIAEKVADFSKNVSKAVLSAFSVRMAS